MSDENPKSSERSLKEEKELKKSIISKDVLLDSFNKSRKELNNRVDSIESFYGKKKKRRRRKSKVNESDLMQSSE